MKNIYNKLSVSMATRKSWNAFSNRTMKKPWAYNKMNKLEYTWIKFQN